MIINYDVNNKGGGGASAEGCVRYDQQQSLTDEQQAQAKENLGIEDPEPQAAVLYTPQTLTTAQQEQARQNIGMGSTFSYTVRYVDDSTGELLAPDKSVTGINYGATVTERAPDLSYLGYQAKRESITKTIVADAIFEFAYIAAGGENGCVRYDQQQSLTDEQQAQAKENLGIEDPEPQAAVLYTPQTLTTAQQKQARQNIGMGSTFSYTVRYVDDSTGELLAPDKSVTGINYGDTVTERAPDLSYLGYQVKRESITKTIVADTIFEFAYIAEGGSSQVQSDWNETDTEDPAFIKNKPTIPQPENHQVLRNALSEPLGCQANTWHTLCEVTVPEDGVYQVSASVCAQPATETSYNAVIVGIATRTGSGDPTEHQEIQLPRSGEYGTMSVPVNATAGQKIQLIAYSSSNFYAQAMPSTGKASATFIAAVRVGATYSE